MDGVIRKRLRCYGWVQGVGFRWRARHAANHFGATGWAVNEPDGSVTMELQGTQEQIDRVIQAVERGAYIQIERMEVKSVPLIPGERGFRTA